MNVEEPLDSMQSFDMALFVETICKRGFASQTKTTAFLFSIKVCGPQMVEQLYCQLVKRVRKVAWVSAFNGAVPIPALGIYMDASLIYNEINLYLRLFDLTKSSIAEIEQKAGKEPEIIEKKLTELFSSRNQAVTLVRDQSHVSDTKDTYKQILPALETNIRVVSVSKEIMKFIVPIVGLAVSGRLSFVLTWNQLQFFLKLMRDAALDVQKWIADKELDKDQDPSEDPDLINVQVN